MKVAGSRNSVPTMLGKKEKTTSNAQSNQESVEENGPNSSDEVLDENSVSEEKEDPVVEVPNSQNSEAEDMEHEAEETEKTATVEQAVVKSRGRSRNTNTSEPPAKKSRGEKKVKGRREPERSSARVANRKVGKKMAEIKDEVVKRKRPSSSKATKRIEKAKDDAAAESDQNGTTEELAAREK